MKTNCAFLLRSRRRRSVGQGLQFSDSVMSVKSLDFFISVLISGELFRTTSGRKDKGGGAGTLWARPAAAHAYAGIAHN